MKIARKKVKYLRTGCGTNLKDPIKQAIEVLDMRETKNEVSTIFFMSDG